MHVRRKRRRRMCGRTPEVQAAPTKTACTATSPGQRTWRNSTSPGRCRTNTETQNCNINTLLVSIWSERGL